MTWILHRYIFRELFKAFALTAVGLTLMFSMGGGLLNLIKIQQVSAADVAKLLLWFLPLVASFMLPIAALLSSALIYGRLAADNELDACKAGGINILRLLVACMILALVSAAGSFYLTNFMAPELIRRIDRIARRDLADFVASKLQDQGSFGSMGYVVYADHARKLSQEEIRQQTGRDEANVEIVYIQGAAFVEFRGDDPARTGTAERAFLVFDKRTEPMTLRAFLQRARLFDHSQRQFLEGVDPSFELTRLPPLDVRDRLKLFDLRELMHYRDEPAATPSMQRRLRQFREKLARAFYFKTLMESLVQPPHMVVLKADWGEYRIRARRLYPARKGRLNLEQVTIEQIGDSRRLYTARRASIFIEGGLEGPVVRVVLEDDVIRQDLEPAGAKPIRLRSGHVLRSVPAPEAAWHMAAGYSDEQILDLSIPLPVPKTLQIDRAGLAKEAVIVGRKINAFIHSRLTLSLSTLVLVPLAAALGIILRGGQALTAFGISFVPTIAVVITIVMGRQLAEKDTTAQIGVVIMWGILLIIAVVDAIVILGAIRR